MSAATTERATREEEEEEAEALRSYQLFSEMSKASILAEAQNGDEHTLDVTVQSHIPVLTFRYMNTTFPLSVMEAEMHNLWNTVIQAAKYWSASNAKHDTLVRHILSARARGTLTRPLATIEADGDISDERLDVILCSDGGEFWSDLPFLGQDLVEEWTERYYRADYCDEIDLRFNLAAFIGRLISVGIHRGPAACVLSLFRETLETPRHLVSAEASINASPGTGDTTKDTRLPVNSLIHALLQMLRHSEGRIIDLSNGDGVDMAEATRPPPQVSSLGELAIQSGLSSPGFSPSRWRFWIQRLEELAKCEVAEIVESAEVCLNYMRYASESVYGPLAGKPVWLTDPLPED
ncbi:hypothetical protein JDV02_006408 [Purpureocillium takamizusanense]|uniref:Uncharacterized protein n=1 Tax=Purpureocillium takamizusanense TaxID=2060973 RepID=A0A9Q8QIA8_9HYPO|nr:uncharacterized protein JDV02_006408 [Purpureocillium takamizusanense]UNI20308.1 hypothetical protein JDV02_006408 [Purpureocillium takamizusanense]